MTQEINQADVLARVAATLESRKPENGGDPEQSYVAKLFKKGDDAILKKIGEEATETVMAAQDERVGNQSVEAVWEEDLELVDLWFHTLVLLSRFGASPADVVNELARREGLSGLVEKASRKE